MAIRSWSWLALLVCLLAVSRIPGVRCDGDEVDDDYQDIDQDRALLVVRKHIKEDSAVQGRNITVSLSLYNAGQSSALSVEVQDAELPDAFKLVDGSLQAKYERIPVGGNVTHQYVVVATAAEGTQVLLPATVKYQAEMESEAFQTGRSNWAEIYLLTPSQQIQKNLLMTGSYLTLGVFKNPGDWRNLTIALLAVIVLLGGNWTYKKLTTAKQTWHREKNLKDFGLDSEDDSSKKQSRKARRQTTEDKES